MVNGTQKENANLIRQSMLLEGCKRLQDILDISEIRYGGLRNVVDFFFLFFRFFWTPQKNKKRASRGVKNTKN